MKSGFRTIYFVLCFVPWVVLPACFGQHQNLLEDLSARFGRRLFAGLLVECLSTVLPTIGVVAAVAAPRGSKLGLLILAGIAAVPGLILTDIPN